MTWMQGFTLPLEGQRVGGGLAHSMRRDMYADRGFVQKAVWEGLGSDDPLAGSHMSRGLTVDSWDQEYLLQLASERWKEEARTLRSMHGVFGERLEDLIHAERHVADGWSGLLRQVLGPLPRQGMEGDLTDWPAYYAGVLLRRDLTKEGGAHSVSIRGWWARGHKIPPLEMASVLLPLFQSLAGEGAVLDETACSGMMAQAPENVGVPRLQITAAQIDELADEIISSRSWDTAYQRSVCRYLLALAEATEAADWMVQWVERWGEPSILERPDWYKLEVMREI